jgi:hypothetical protein
VVDGTGEQGVCVHQGSAAWCTHDDTAGGEEFRLKLRSPDSLSNSFLLPAEHLPFSLFLSGDTWI